MNDLVGLPGHRMRTKTTAQETNLGHEPKIVDPTNSENILGPEPKILDPNDLITDDDEPGMVPELVPRTVSRAAARKPPPRAAGRSVRRRQ